MPLVKTFEEACQVVNIDPAKVLPDISCFPVPHQAALIAAGKLFIIADALNEGWSPDWTNDDEYKYYPWFDMEKDENVNRSGFRLDVVNYDYSGSNVGSRLCFKTRALAEYAATQFLDVYRDLFIL